MPCRYCEKRHPACHDTCEDYQAEKACHDERKLSGKTNMLKLIMLVLW